MLLKTLRGLTLFAISMSFSAYTAAQPQEAASPHPITSADYAHAEKFMAYNTNPLVYHAVHPVWTADERLWYRDAGPEGDKFVLFDPAKLTKEPAFDHTKLAAALSVAAGKTYEANKLPFREMELSAGGHFVSFRIGKRQFRCDQQGSKCVVVSGGAENSVASPDSKKLAFVKDYNLWVRDVFGGKDTQLTMDGVKDYSYALDNAGWIKSDNPILLWSPDSKKIATFKQDQRNVGEMNQSWPPGVASLEVSAARGRRSVDDRESDHRRGCAKGDSAANAAGPASLDAVRPRHLSREPMGGRRVEPGFRQAGVCFHVERAQAGNAPHRGY